MSLKKLKKAFFQDREPKLQCSEEAIVTMEACLKTFLLEVGRNLAQVLHLMKQSTVSPAVTLAYAEVGLHLTSSNLDKLKVLLETEPAKPEGKSRASLAMRYSLNIESPPVISIVKAGMEDYFPACAALRTSDKTNTGSYSTSPAARAALAWIAETVSTHFLEKAVLAAGKRGAKKIKGVDIECNWMNNFIHAQASL